jgi:hypothetical protein
MPTTSKKLTVFSYTFDSAKIATALKLTSAIVDEDFKDGRVISRFSEHWGAAIYAYVKHQDTNYEGSDGEVKLGNLGTVPVSVKSLTNSGLKIQKSIDTHSGKVCGKDELLSACRACSYYLVVDITNFPLVKFVSVPSSTFISWIEDDKITKTGVSKEKFYKMLSKAYQLEHKTLTDADIEPVVVQRPT